MPVVAGSMQLHSCLAVSLCSKAKQEMSRNGRHNQGRERHSPERLAIRQRKIGLTWDGPRGRNLTSDSVDFWLDGCWVGACITWYVLLVVE